VFYLYMYGTRLLFGSGSNVRKAREGKRECQGLGGLVTEMNWGEGSVKTKWSVCAVYMVIYVLILGNGHRNCARNSFDGSTVPLII
jgi:hypothetical protein